MDSVLAPLLTEPSNKAETLNLLPQVALQLPKHHEHDFMTQSTLGRLQTLATSFIQLVLLNRSELRTFNGDTANNQ